MKLFVDASFLIYLNASTDEKTRQAINNLFKSIIKDELYTDMLVVDEVLFISARKYKLSYSLTFKFLDSVVMPFTEIVPIDQDDYEKVKQLVELYNIKPSDAIHLSAMYKVGAKKIVTEDEDFNKVQGIERLWLKS